MKVADPQHFNVDPDPAFHFNADTDPDPAHRQSAAITCLNNLQASIVRSSAFHGSILSL
jgi:hypothetical protein